MYLLNCFMIIVACEAAVEFYTTRSLLIKCQAKESSLNHLLCVHRKKTHVHKVQNGHELRMLEKKEEKKVKVCFLKLINANPTKYKHKHTNTHTQVLVKRKS